MNSREGRYGARGWKTNMIFIVGKWVGGVPGLKDSCAKAWKRRDE